MKPVATHAELIAAGFVEVTPGHYMKPENPQLRTLLESVGVIGETKPITKPEPDGFDSNLEREFMAYCSLMGWQCERKLPNFPLVAKGKRWWTYRPDFLVKMDNNEVAFIEIKPNFIKREARIGELKISLFAEFCARWGWMFYRVTRTNGQWFFEQQAGKE